MELQEFIGKFAEQFENTETSKFKADTEFRTLDEWSSLIALSVMAMVDEEYNIKLKGDDMRNSNTIKDLYDIIQSERIR